MTIILDNLQTILLNIFFIHFCFSIYFKFIERKTNKVTNEIIIALVSGTSIVLCMTFPSTLPTGYIIDFGQVPLIVGALYGGHRVAVFLVFILLSYHFYLDIPGFDLSLVIYCLLVISLWDTISHFNKTTIIGKKLYLSILASLLGIISKMTMVFLFIPGNITMHYLVLFISLLITQSIGVIFFVIFNEKARKDAILAKELVKLEKLRTVSELAASISHEVRNPLTVIKGFLQLLSEPSLTDQDKKDYIETSLEALDQAESRITDYLTFAKPSLENIKILDLYKELSYIRNFIDPYAAMNNVHIETSIEEEIYIAGEDEKIHQCLINIVKNGIESMPQGGTLLIKLRCIEDHAIITVTDEGIGMDEEQVERLGSPFFSTKDLGTGIGTMVVYSIVKAMQGEIHVESELGKGTSFSILLPVAENSPSFNREIVKYLPSL